MNCSFQGLSRATLVQSAMWSTGAKITRLALLFMALGVPEGVAQVSDAAGSVHGSIFTPISLDRVGVIDPPAPSNTAGERILLPDFEVHLIEVSSGQRGGSTKTDLFGRYYLHNQPPGIYRLCWRNRGWIDGCAPDSLTVNANITYMDSQAVLPQLNRTQDGSTRGDLGARQPRGRNLSLVFGPVFQYQSDG